MNVSIEGRSVGERIVVLGLVVELLADNWDPAPQPMDLGTCTDLCWGQDLRVQQLDAWACVCSVDVHG